MYKFRNISTKEDVQKYMEWVGIKIQSLEPITKHQHRWNIQDRFENEWNLIFRTNENEWTICNVCHSSGDIPFSVSFISNGRDVEILRAEKNGKHYKADRFLKSFSKLILMVNGYINFGYIAV